jgi:hypothetical protein
MRPSRRHRDAAVRAGKDIVMKRTRKGLVLVGIAFTLAAATAFLDASRSSGGFTFALIGDTPYGESQRLVFPNLVDTINADGEIQFVLHAGDIKNGASTCDDLRFADLAALYDTFQVPFILTPGDNEWTDCHRTTAGGYLPTERLEALRRLFFADPGWTTGGRRMPVISQASDPEHGAYVENVMFMRSHVVFATVHVVGSENDLQPWSQLPGGDQPGPRLAEFQARKAAALAWIDAAFALAEKTHAAGVLLMMQAEPTATPGFIDIRRRIADLATAYGSPVLLVHGDEHRYEVEPSYAGVENLTRLETFGDTAAFWLRVTINPGDPNVFRWTPVTVD